MYVWCRFPVFLFVYIVFTNHSGTPACCFLALSTNYLVPLVSGYSNCFTNPSLCSDSLPEWKLINSLAPGRFEQNLRYVIFQLISVTDGWDISCKIALRWMPLDLTDDESTMVQVMAWCRQATSHYLNQCWPRSLSPYGVTRPQWVSSSHLGQNGRHFADDIFKCIFMNGKFCISIQISLKFVPKGLTDKSVQHWFG